MNSFCSVALALITVATYWCLPAHASDADAPTFLNCSRNTQTITLSGSYIADCTDSIGPVVVVAAPGARATVRLRIVAGCASLSIRNADVTNSVIITSGMFSVASATIATSKILAATATLMNSEISDSVLSASLFSINGSTLRSSTISFVPGGNAFSMTGTSLLDSHVCLTGGYFYGSFSIRSTTFVGSDLVINGSRFIATAGPRSTAVALVISDAKFVNSSSLSVTENHFELGTYNGPCMGCASDTADGVRITSTDAESVVVIANNTFGPVTSVAGFDGNRGVGMAISITLQGDHAAFADSLGPSRFVPRGLSPMTLGLAAPTRGSQYSGELTVSGALFDGGVVQFSAFVVRRSTIVASTVELTKFTCDSITIDASTVISGSSVVTNSEISGSDLRASVFSINGSTLRSSNISETQYSGELTVSGALIHGGVLQFSAFGVRRSTIVASTFQSTKFTCDSITIDASTVISGSSVVTNSELSDSDLRASVFGINGSTLRSSNISLSPGGNALSVTGAWLFNSTLAASGAHFAGSQFAISGTTFVGSDLFINGSRFIATADPRSKAVALVISDAKFVNGSSLSVTENHFELGTYNGPCMGCASDTADGVRITSTDAEIVVVIANNTFGPVTSVANFGGARGVSLSVSLIRLAVICVKGNTFMVTQPQYYFNANTSVCDLEDCCSRKPPFGLPASRAPVATSLGWVKANATLLGGAIGRIGVVCEWKRRNTLTVSSSQGKATHSRSHSELTPTKSGSPAASLAVSLRSTRRVATRRVASNSMTYHATFNETPLLSMTFTPLSTRVSCDAQRTASRTRTEALVVVDGYQIGLKSTEAGSLPTVTAISVGAIATALFNPPASGQSSRLAAMQRLAHCLDGSDGLLPSYLDHPLQGFLPSTSADDRERLALATSTTVGIVLANGIVAGALVFSPAVPPRGLLLHAGGVAYAVATYFHPAIASSVATLGSMRWGFSNGLVVASLVVAAVLWVVLVYTLWCRRHDEFAALGAVEPLASTDGTAPNQLQRRVTHMLLPIFAGCRSPSVAGVGDREWVRRLPLADAVCALLVAILSGLRLQREEGCFIGVAAVALILAAWLGYMARWQPYDEPRDFRYALASAVGQLVSCATAALVLASRHDSGGGIDMEWTATIMDAVTFALSALYFVEAGHNALIGACSRTGAAESNRPTADTQVPLLKMTDRHPVTDPASEAPAADIPTARGVPPATTAGLMPRSNPLLAGDYSRALE
jgi:hypothetical protein